MVDYSAHHSGVLLQLEEDLLIVGSLLPLFLLVQQLPQLRNCREEYVTSCSVREELLFGFSLESVANIAY